MGIADIVPGVSGGTIALLTGIYERLINAIKSAGVDTLKLLFSSKEKGGGIKAAWQQFDGTFLFSVFFGIAVSILLLSRFMHYLIEQFPMFIWPLFFGLVLASVFYVGKQIKQWNIERIFWLILGTVIAASIALSSPTEVEITPLTLFVVGSIAICAMILPGISGSFLLLLMGVYAPMIAAIKGLDIPTLAIFASGCAVGIMAFSRLLSWLLAHYHEVMMATLTGFMLGALVKLWPWKAIITTRTNSKGQEVPFLEQPIFPWDHADPQLLMAITGMILGLVSVFAVDYLAKKAEKPDPIS